jgi:hypothetical protein
MTSPTDRGGLRRVARRVLAIGQWVAEREKLPQSEPGLLPRRSTLNNMIRLTGHESLPFISQPVKEQGRFLSWLIGSEQLPIATFDHQPGAGSLFRWLLTAEQPTIAPIPEPTKEASSDEP